MNRGSPMTEMGKARLAGVYAALGLRSIPTIVKVSPVARSDYLLNRWGAVLAALAK